MGEIPSKDDLLEWIRQNPDAAGKREIARAFGIRGADRIELKRLLRELQDEGLVAKERKRMRLAGTLPPVTVLRIEGPDAAGDLLARPATWHEDGPAPTVLVVPKGGDPALGRGDRILAKVRPVEDAAFGYEARLIKRIGDGARRVLGVYRRGPEGGRIVPVDKGANREWSVPAGEAGDARDGELVEAEDLGGPRLGLPRGRIVIRHGDPGAPRAVSLIAMVQHGIPYEFPVEVLAEADRAEPLVDGRRREDLRHLRLVTIDPADARDHDDAVCAMADDDAANPGGHVVWVAIADVAGYVRTGTALDREALRRGNSTYFPDRVSPMLPEGLSTDLCSLIDGADRPCLAVRMVLDARGNKIGHRFVRGQMRSAASLTYEAVQAAEDGHGGIDPALLEGVIRPLYSAYRATAAARERRQPLDLDLPERRIELDAEGRVVDIAFRDRLDAHRLIEEFMVLANVAAAEALEAKRSPLLYRVHEEPSPEKLDALRETVEASGLALAKGQVLRTRDFNRLLDAARGTDSAETLSMSVLRAQTQAYYSPQNLGHFGLNLPRYAHFTSPIRRYADLVVHRALISAFGLGDDGLRRDEIASLAETAEHISMTERRSMDAERDTVDRYVAAYLSDRIGADFKGRIAGVSRAGAFVRLDETGADGLVPISTLGTDYFRHDPQRQTLTGERTGRVLALGMPVIVRLREAAPVSGGLILELLSVDGAAMSPPRRRGGAKREGPRNRAHKVKAARAGRRRS